MKCLAWGVSKKYLDLNHIPDIEVQKFSFPNELVVKRAKVV
jgi:hypothetical protein